MSRQITAAGAEFIRHEEGCVLQAYDDATGKVVPRGGSVRGTLTIGIGHAGDDVYIGQTITEAQAFALLDKDLDAAEDAIERLVKVPLNDNEHAALVAFVFNVGEPRFSTSTLLRLLNAGDRAGAAGQFSRWNKTTIAGRLVESDGLVGRRAREAALFATPPSAASPPRTAPSAPLPAPIPEGRSSPPVAAPVPDKTPANSVTIFGIGLTALSQTLDYVAEQSHALQSAIPWLGYVFAAATVAGLAIAAYGRLRVMKTEGV
jgi:lysozyme